MGFTPVRSLDRCHPWLAVSAGPPDGAGWLRLDRVSQGVTLDAALRRTAATTGGHGGATAAYLTGWVAGAVVWPVVAGPVLFHRRPAVRADGLWVGHPPGRGWIDRVAVSSDASWIPDDLEDPAGAAGAIRRLLTPLIGALSGRGMLAHRALWNLVGDAVCEALVTTADGSTATALTAALLDGLGTVTRRPTVIEVTAGPTRRTVRLRGGCCLAVRVGHGLCATCPALDVTERGRRLARWAAAQVT